MEIADIMYKIRNRQSNLIPDDLAGVSGDIAVMITAWEEALTTDPVVASWIQSAQNAALGAHMYILDDGPELPKGFGPYAEEGGEVLEGMYAQGCTRIEEAKTQGRSGRAGGQVSAAETRSGPAGIVSKDPRIVLT
jgi:hypothetical protein